MNVWYKILLTPLSAVYSAVTACRNAMFDAGILKSAEYGGVPVICVGNVTAGGTGKTPHVEYIVSVLKEKYRVAVLSRGYKRKTRGFVMADAGTEVYDIGDEPMQIHRKFPDVIVACCGKRTEGIEKLLNLPEPPQVIVLDDAFQHRYVKAGMNVLLSDYNRPAYEDKMLPLGRLRENFRQAVYRATHVIVTKCPDTISPIEKRVIETNLNLYHFQQLFFSRTDYGRPCTLSGNSEAVRFGEWLSRNYKNEASLLVVTGIASPEPFIKYIRKFFPDRFVDMRFADHHKFRERDIEKISSAFRSLPGKNKFIVTTEKDAVRLSGTVLPDWCGRVYYVPVEPHFMYGKKPFSEEILNYVGENQKKC